jgi:hypothetical protein
MNDRPRYADSTSEDRVLPGWLMVAAIVVALAVLLLLSMMLIGGLHMPRPH